MNCLAILIGLSFNLLACGCQKFSLKSMNLQRAALRSTGDTSATLGLDATAIESVDEAKAKTKEIAVAVRQNLKTGDLSLLPLADVQAALARSCRRGSVGRFGCFDRGAGC